MSVINTVNTDPESIIPAEQARAILEAAIAERLGADWQDAGWTQVTGHDYMARMTQGRVNIDFYVDLLGNVTVEEREIDPAYDQVPLLIVVFLLLSVVIAMLLAQIVGWL